MWQAMRRQSLTVIVLIAAAAAPAPAAWASTTPTLSLNQSAGKTAGAAANLGLDLKFVNTGTDSPHQLTINLPPGLLANASINGGSCLRTANVSGSTCEVGSGTVTATPDPIPGVLNLPLSVSVPVTFFLVPPPAAGDLAGLAVEGLGEQIGSTGEIKIRPTGDPSGVGVTLNLVLPDTLPLTLPLIGTIHAAQISLTEINSTFNGLRYPTTCPSTPAKLSASVDSYSDPAVHIVSAPLSVTGCSSLSYSPVFKVTAARDSNDRQVKLATTITQTASQAPSRSVSLAFPTSTLAPNLQSIKALCLNLASGSCPTVGSASATSPLYPTTLSGNAYLTGSASGLSLTLVFPSPFPLTLAGSVNLVRNSATFTGLPDIPLTNLGVTLAGGTEGLFLSTCQAPSGTATATMTDQNGDKSVNAPANFTVSGCSGGGGSGASGSGGAGGGGGGGGGGAGGAGGGGSSGNGGGANGSTRTGVTVGSTKLSKGGLSGLGTGHASLRFTISVAKHAPKLTALTIEPPTGISLIPHRAGNKLIPTGITLTGAKIKSLALAHNHLLITLRKPSQSLTITINSSALKVSPTLKAKAKTKQLRHLPLTVITTNTNAQRTTIRVQINSLRP